MKAPILITGIARSGTSLVAGLVHGCGAKCGAVGKSGDKWNPTGYYENYEMIDKIDKMILRGLGCDTMGQSNLPPLDIPNIYIREKVFRIARDQGIRPNETWYFKDAKLLLIVGSYKMSFPDSKFILVRREKEAIIKSCMRTPFMSLRSTEEQWGEWVDLHQGYIDKLKKGNPMVREVRYEDLVCGKWDEFHEIVNWLQLEYDEEFIKSFIIKK